MTLIKAASHRNTQKAVGDCAGAEKSETDDRLPGVKAHVAIFLLGREQESA